MVRRSFPGERRARASAAFARRLSVARAAVFCNTERPERGSGLDFALALVFFFRDECDAGDARGAFFRVAMANSLNLESKSRCQSGSCFIVNTKTSNHSGWILAIFTHSPYLRISAA